MNTNKQNIWQPLVYALVLAIGITGGYFLQNKSSNGYSLTGNKKLDQVIGLINTSYVDTVNDNELTEKAIIEMLHNLDPHSSYIPARDLKEANQQLDGNFEGIGIEFNLLDDTIFVVTVLPGGPAEKAGLMPGDKIIKVEGETVAGIDINNADVAKKLKGKKDTKVKVAVKRIGEKELLPIVIIRGRIPLYSVEATYMITKNTGYIKLISFSQNTNAELDKAVKSLKEKGMANLILDLRDNGGGYLSAANSVASEFLEGKKLIVYTEGRRQGKVEHTTTGKGKFTTGKLIVLVNENSASASEIVSGAIQDWDRGIIIGRRTFGKGLVQESFSLKDGSALRLTIARYYTPTGRSIQKPYSDGYDTYNLEINERYKAGEYDHPDSVKKNTELEFKTPSGRKVYGGGGVYPDVFVPLDSAIHSKLLGKIYAKGIINRVVYSYYAHNREALLAKYKTGEKFVSDFSFDATFKAQIKQQLNKYEVEFSEGELNEIMPDINRRAKANIANQLFNREVFYMALNNGDNVIDAALESLSKYEAILQGTSNLVVK